MMTPAKIDETELRTQIELLFGISISEMIFIPRGETSWGYKVIAKDRFYFLKLYRKKPQYLEEATELTYKLFTQCHINAIVHAIEAQDGKTVHEFNEFPFVLFNFIEGREVAEQKLTDEQLEEMGRILGKIHASTKSIGEYPKEETFESKDKEHFLKVVERIKQHKKEENEYQKKFVDLLMPLQERVIKELQSLEHLRDVLRAKRLPFVICHSDPTQGNILVGTDGKLYLIDWDMPILAPKERDLLFFTDRLEPFMKGYAAVTGENKLDADAKQFYIHEWNVQEIADLGSKLLFEVQDEAQNKHDLAEFIHFLDYSGIGTPSTS